MSESSTPTKPIKTFKIPETLRERIEKRNEHIERINEHLQNLKALNQESLTAFLEGQKLPKNVDVKFNQKDWAIEVFKTEKK